LLNPWNRRLCLQV